MSPTLTPLEQLPLRLAMAPDGSVSLQFEGDFTLVGIDFAPTSVSHARALQTLERMVAAYNGTLGHVHNTDECDPDGHIVFTSVCCGARLYRCAATEDGLPSKPLIHQGEDTCRSCGQVLAQF